MATQPDLGITNPYALDDTQFQAAVDLLKAAEAGGRRVLGRLHQADRTRSTNGNTVIGTTWQVIANLLQGADPAVQVEVDQARRGRDRLVRHLDDQLEDQEPQLRLHVRQPHHLGAESTSRSPSTSARPRATRSRAPWPSTRTTATSSTPTTTAYWEDVWYWTTPVAECLDGRTDVTCKDFDAGSRPGPRSAAADPSDARPLTTARTPRRSAPRAVPSPDAMTVTTPPTAARTAPIAARRAARGVAASPPADPPRGCSWPRPIGWLVIVYLGSLRDPVPQRVLHARRVHAARRSTSPPSTTSPSCSSDPYPGITLRTVAMAAAVTVDLRRPGLPDRLLHGPGRVAARSAALLVVAVIVPLWASYLDQGLLVAAHPGRGGHAELAARAARACRARATATSRSGSSSPTSGCRT